MPFIDTTSTLGIQQYFSIQAIIHMTATQYLLQDIFSLSLCNVICFIFDIIFKFLEGFIHLLILKLVDRPYNSSLEYAFGNFTPLPSPISRIVAENEYKAEPLTTKYILVKVYPKSSYVVCGIGTQRVFNTPRNTKAQKIFQLFVKELCTRKEKMFCPKKSENTNGGDNVRRSTCMCIRIYNYVCVKI